MNNRLQKLLAMVERNPGEPFSRYALALEYRSQGRQEEAASVLRSLLAKSPEYVPAYLQLGMLLGELELRPEARQIASSGIELASRVGELKAAAELEALLDQLGEE